MSAGLDECAAVSVLVAQWLLCVPHNIQRPGFDSSQAALLHIILISLICLVTTSCPIKAEHAE